MKKIVLSILAIAALSLSAFSAKADDIIFSGVTGSSGLITQQINGGSVTFTWSGDFFGGSASGTDTFFNNQVDGSDSNTNLVSFLFTPNAGFQSVADFTILSQRDFTGRTIELGPNGIADAGILSTNGIFDITAQTGISSLTGDGTNELTYGDTFTNTPGQFDANISNASTFSYEYTVTNGGIFRDSFAVSVSAIPLASVTAVPEPTSAVLLLAGGIALLARRKRN